MPVIVIKCIFVNLDVEDCMALKVKDRFIEIGSNRRLYRTSCSCKVFHFNRSNMVD